MFQIAQQVTDKVLGKGAYQHLNGFNPANGETYKKESPQKPKAKNKKKRP